MRWLCNSVENRNDPGMTSDWPWPLQSQKYRKTSEWQWILKSQKYPLCTKFFPPRPKFWSVSLCDYCFPATRLSKTETLEMHRMTLEWPWTLKSKVPIYNKYLPRWSWRLNSQKYPVYTKICVSFPLRSAVFKITHIYFPINYHVRR